MKRKDSNGRRVFLVSVACLIVLVGCAVGGKAKKGPARGAAEIVTEPAPQAISTGDIAVWSRDEKVVDGAWMRTTGLASDKKLSEGITFSLMATDRSQKSLAPEPVWRVADPSVASVKPSVGQIVTVSVLGAGKTAISVTSGSRYALIALEATADGAKIRFQE